MQHSKTVSAYNTRSIRLPHRTARTCVQEEIVNFFIPANLHARSVRWKSSSRSFIVRILSRHERKVGKQLLCSNSWYLKLNIALDDRLADLKQKSFQKTSRWEKQIPNPQRDFPFNSKPRILLEMFCSSPRNLLYRTRRIAFHKVWLNLQLLCTKNMNNRNLKNTRPPLPSSAIEFEVKNRTWCHTVLVVRVHTNPV